MASQDYLRESEQGGTDPRKIRNTPEAFEASKSMRLFGLPAPATLACASWSSQGAGGYPVVGPVPPFECSARSTSIGVCSQNGLAIPSALESWGLTCSQPLQ